MAGSSFELYSVNLYLGDQGPFSVVVDSGSWPLIVAGDAVAGAGGISPTYMPVNEVGSSTRVGYGCGVGFQGEGQTGWEGNVTWDTVTFADNTRLRADADLFFVTNGFPGDSDIPFFECLNNGVADHSQGILGIAVRDDGPADDTILTMLNQQQGVPSVIAAKLCLRGGKLWFGGYAPDSVLSTPRFVAMDNPQFLGMHVGGSKLPVDASDLGPLGFDTGTTRLTLPERPFNTLTGALTNNSNFTRVFETDFFSSKNCFLPKVNISREQLDASLPTISMAFQAVDGSPLALEMNATSSYLTPNATVWPTVQQYCSGIERMDDGGFANTTLYGNTFMKTVVQVLDYERRLVGFAPTAPCDEI